ncbi:transcriptional regulator, GntR family [Tranquillimonas rosea]|uniref:Transcriptional regulator, GntR family n=1 Tax=Tranquillimonas rosea TaxID=641238 RepID=A0A1H9VFU4_9RHOB|nr:GntR family transcriptional regulator [Tranquillimonas rosea]SES20565.1 transcriptional regulator, GntR family [Tranquillimonas rosea]
MAELEKKTRFLKALMALRELVMAGGLKPGERLSEVAVAERVGISRTPVREAMAQLVEEGLLDRISTGGYCVRQITVADVVDSIEMRGMVEGLALRMAAERGAAPERLSACRTILDRIDDALGEHESRMDFSTYADLNSAFHDELTSLCNSPIVLRELKRVSNLPLAAPSAFLQGQTAIRMIRRSLYHAQVHHRAMLDAVSSHEGARAEALAREHARLARVNLDHVIQSREEVEAQIPGLALVTGV